VAITCVIPTLYPEKHTGLASCVVGNVLILATEKSLMQKESLLKNALNKAKAKGVKIRIAAPISKINKGAAELLGKYGVVKHVDDIKARFCVIDGKAVTLMALDDTVHPNYDFGVWVNTEFLAKAFENIFNMLWARAK
ncbi:MAG: hypothetical protein QW666_03925, partial [Candidatus Woesearchaeota archaeon]